MEKYYGNLDDCDDVEYMQGVRFPGRVVGVSEQEAWKQYWQDEENSWFMDLVETIAESVWEYFSEIILWNGYQNSEEFMLSEQREYESIRQAENLWSQVAF